MGANGTSFAAEALDPVLQRVTRELRIERRAERLVVVDASLPRAEALVAADLRRRQRADQPFPELLERREMDRDQAAVRRAQDVRLREPRPIAGLRRAIEREERGERLDGEVRHRFEHRDFDQTAASGAAALEQRAEHAVRRVDAGDRIRERRTEKARTVGIDDDAEKAAQRLRDRVVARAIRVRAARAEAADRAVDELWIEILQPLPPGAESLGGAGTEVLDVDVGARDQIVEDACDRRPR